MTDPPPRAADMRALLPPARDQGERGTCVAFAVSAAHEFARAAGAAVSEDLSEEALYWGCKVQDGNWADGTHMSSAAIALAGKGQPLEAVWPYELRRRAGNSYAPPSPPDADWHTSDLQRATVDLAAVRAQLDADRPVVLVATVFSTLFRPSAEGRIEAPPVGSSPFGRHAVLAVGYDRDAVLIRNSWGPTWALDGYGWLAVDYVELYVTEAWIIEPATPGTGSTASA